MAPAKAMLIFFEESELACPATGELVLAPGFGAALDALRAAYGAPMRLSSACRTAERNRRIGGHPRSLHLIANAAHSTDTCAVDVIMSDGAARRKLVEAALSQKWSVGVASNFIHVDQRSAHTGLPQVLYHYRR